MSSVALRRLGVNQVLRRHHGVVGRFATGVAGIDCDGPGVAALVFRGSGFTLEFVTARPGMGV